MAGGRVLRLDLEYDGAGFSGWADQPGRRTVEGELTAALAKGEAADGLIAAVAAVGAHLAQHFPPETRNHNELPDHFIVLQ